MSTHVDGAAPSVAPDPDDGEPHDDDVSCAPDVGSAWVRAEMLRRMAVNRSTRGRHARGGEVVAPALPEREGPTGAAAGRRPRRRPEPAQPWVAECTSPADLPENYVPRHSVQTPGPAADPAAPISGPIPIVRPAGAPIGGGAGDGPVGGPSLPPTGLPRRRRRGSGSGSPLPADGTATGPWSRPGPIVPNEPVYRLGAPPAMLGHPKPTRSWGAPPAPPQRTAGPVPPLGPESGDGPPAVDAVSAVDAEAAVDAVGVVDAGPAVDGAGDDVLTVDDVEVTDPTGAAVRPAVDQPAAGEQAAVPTAVPAAATTAVPAAAPASPPASVPAAPEQTGAAERPADAEPGAAPDTQPGATTPEAPAADGPLSDVVETGPSGDDGDTAHAGDTGPGGLDDAPTPAPAAGPGGPVGNNGVAPAGGPTATGAATTRPDDAVGPSSDRVVAGTPPRLSPLTRPRPTTLTAGPGDTRAVAPSATSTETTGEITDLPTAPHPVVLAQRTAMSGRLVGLPAQRISEQARTVAPRPMTPRNVPVVGTAPLEPGSTRVRVVLSERKGVARPVRTIKEVQEGTAVGELLRRDLIRSQLWVTLRFALLTAVVLGALPAVFALLPEISRLHVLGLRLPWVLVGVLMYPFLVGVAWRYTRVADRVEQNFADHVQD